jgi:S1-C subfamily serine protease
MKVLHSIMAGKQRSRFIVLLAVVVMLFAGVAAGCTAASGITVAPSPQVSSTTPALNTSAVSSLYDENTVEALYQQTIPGVVEIQTVISASSSEYGPFRFNVPSQTGQGSGFFIDTEGHILTNNHVVENARAVTVTLHDGKTVEAEVIGNDAQNDLALLQVSTGEIGTITSLPLGNSDSIKPGQMAIAMGSPFGLEGSITVGIVSGVGRSLPGAGSRTIVNVIQTDAAINPGNSGGPLLNSRGEVIGINTAIEPSGSSIGFAIPIKTATSLLPALLKGGEVQNPWLGIQGTTIDSELQTSLGLATDRGIYIIGIVENSPAEKAGLKESGVNNERQPVPGGDIITAVDSVTVEKMEDLISYLNSKKPGDNITLTVYRGDRQITVSVTLGEWPKEMPS